VKKVALVTVHGMGSTPREYNAELRRELFDRLGSTYDQLHIGSVYYQGILEPNERRVWESVAKKVRWDDLRKFLLFGFADAAGLESNKQLAHSVYTLAQVEFARELYLAYKAVGPTAPVIMLAQSLGGQVASCYFWDSIKARSGVEPDVGFWHNVADNHVAVFENDSPSPEAIAFMQGATLSHLFTTGCNIPIFVAAHATVNVKPIRPNDSFVWTNYYDKDDVLGWPLAPLSAEYSQVVRDVPVNSGGGVLGWISSSWNPMSHTQYWRDDEVLDPLEEAIRQALE
jgi:hypothetical protein